jgi:hypothetical protein
MTGVSLNPNTGATGVNTLQSDTTNTQLTGLDALREQPSFTFAGAGNDLNDYTPPARPGILDKDYDAQGRYIGNGVEGPFSILNEPGWDPQGDYDDDGIENQDEQIIVSGPPRMANTWEKMTTYQQIVWNVAYSRTSSEVVADSAAKTNISGKNPDDPYTSAENLQEGLKELASEAANAAYDSMFK